MHFIAKIKIKSIQHSEETKQKKTLNRSKNHWTGQCIYFCNFVKSKKKKCPFSCLTVKIKRWLLQNHVHNDTWVGGERREITNPKKTKILYYELYDSGWAPVTFTWNTLSFYRILGKEHKVIFMVFLVKNLYINVFSMLKKISWATILFS